MIKDFVHYKEEENY